MVKKIYKSSRLANIELLRVVCMGFVLLAHYVVPFHGVVTLDSIHSAPLSAIFHTFIFAFCAPCVDSFIIISGYFGIKWRWKGLLGLLFTMLFWMSIIPYIANWTGSIDGFSAWEYFLDIIFFYRANWFFLAYLVLYAISPILNSFLNNESNNRIFAVIVAFYFVQTYFGYILKQSSEFADGLSSMSFIGLYLIGGYIRRSDLSYFCKSTKYYLTLYLLLTFFLMVLSYIFKFCGYTFEVFGYINPVVIIESIVLFLLFRSWHFQKYEKIVLFFSSSVFAVLLAHSRQGADIWFKGHQWIVDNTNYPILFAVIFMLLFYVSAIVIDKLRIFIWDFFCRCIEDRD